jgi:hypothetical protein
MRAALFYFYEGRRVRDAGIDDNLDRVLHNIVYITLEMQKELNLSGGSPDVLDDLNHEFNIHSFIVRVLEEESGLEKHGETWRGQIIHIPGGERHYFTDIKEIPAFIAAYLKA